MNNRVSWDDYFMQITELISARSTCLRRSVGAILVRDNHILSTGYNGAPSNLKHCDKVGCLRERLKIPSGEKHEICRAVHAEQNCIIQAAVYGISIKQSILFCTNFPCAICAKILINAGIDTIVYQKDYPDSISQNLLQEAGVIFMQHKGDK